MGGVAGHDTIRLAGYRVFYHRRGVFLPSFMVSHYRPLANVLASKLHDDPANDWVCYPLAVAYSNKHYFLTDLGEFAGDRTAEDPEPLVFTPDPFDGWGLTNPIQKKKKYRWLETVHAHGERAVLPDLL